MHNAPININTATRNDFLRLPFLNEEKTDSILAYRERKDGFLSFGELMFITRLNHADRSFIPLFFSCTPLEHTDTLSTGKKLWKGKHNISTRFYVPLYRRAGYSGSTETNYYFGKPFANTVRYRYNFQEQIAYGFTLQQDEGEPFAVAKSYPYDYMSAYFQYASPSGKLKWLVGDYRLSAGEGLLLGNNFFSSRALLVESSTQKPQGFTKNTGCDEINYFRGAALKFKFKEWQFLAFSSYRRLDAIIKNDTVTSFQTTGYHRTLSEHRRKGNVGAALLGFGINRHFSTCQLGLTAYYAHYNKTIYPALKDYNRYYLRGRNAGGISLHYAHNGRLWDFQGETAMDAKGNIAASHTLRYRPKSDIMNLLIQMRNFSPRFVAPYASTLGSSSRVSNEHALLIGTNITAIPHTNITLYAEGFLRPRPAYRTLKKSKGFELYANATYRFSNYGPWLINMQYRLKGKQENVSGHNIMQYIRTNRGKLALEYAGKTLNLLMAFNTTYIKRQTGASSLGWSASLRSRYSFSKSMNATISLAYFDTDDYASRIYVYEPQLRYAAGFPTLYYQGIRSVALVNYKIRKWGELGFRYAISHYLDRSTISSGAQLISHATKQDISLHLMVKW